MPFISEEVWQKVAPLLGNTSTSIMLESYPRFESAAIDIVAEEHIDWLKGIIIAIRNIRGEMDISPAKNISVMLRNGEQDDMDRLESYRPYLQKLAKLEKIEWLEKGDEGLAAATQLYKNLEILVPLAGLIDVEAERIRLAKEISKFKSRLDTASHKLNNANFIKNDLLLL
jgi:valyl-tRNA synthetase